MSSESPIWTIKAALDWTQGYLATNGAENPRLEAQWLLTAATGLTRLELYTNHDQPLTGEQRATLREGIKRRVAGEPLQYILGRAPFRRLELRVRSGVLIPRPETEVLVDLVLEELRAREDSTELRVLDLCTGSGCIALSLLQEYSGLAEHPGLAERPKLRVVATDIDPAAVELARENAALLGVGDDESLTILLDDLATTLLADPVAQGSFDVLVSNPPYIPTPELDTLPKEVVEYEPRQALDGGSDGLKLFRRIVEQARLLLKPKGLIACELHETSLEEAKTLCERAGLTTPLIHQDLTKTPRLITARQADAD